MKPAFDKIAAGLEHTITYAPRAIFLIYRLDEGVGKGGTIVFMRADTHSELFGE